MLDANLKWADQRNIHFPSAANGSAYSPPGKGAFSTHYPSIANLDTPVTAWPILLSIYFVLLAILVLVLQHFLHCCNSGLLSSSSLQISIGNRAAQHWVLPMSSFEVFWNFHLSFIAFHLAEAICCTFVYFWLKLNFILASDLFVWQYGNILLQIKSRLF